MLHRIGVIIGLFALQAPTASLATTDSPWPERLGVTVTYALVPKDRLADAVKGISEAQDVETAWRKALAASQNPTETLFRTSYSIVVFVHNTATQAIFGKLGFLIQSPNRPTFILNVDLSPGYDGTYVIDGGGILPEELPKQKRYSWLEFHFE